MSGIDWKEQTWESSFYGFRVACLYPPFNAEELSELKLKLAEEQFRFVYGFVDPASSEQHAMEQHGGTIITTRASFGLHLSDTHAHADARSATEEDLPELEVLAIQSGLYSRYRKDPRFPEELHERMYRAWVRNALDRSFGDEVLVVMEEESLAGMVTLSKNENKATIGLFAVLNIYRKIGVGRRLMDAAIDWSRQQGCRDLEVTTQVENRAACNFYAGRGFDLLRIENAVHLWM